MNDPTLATRPTLIQTTSLRPPGVLREGLQLIGQVIVSSMTAGFIFMLCALPFFIIGGLVAIIADLTGRS